MFDKIDHIAVAVKNIDEAAEVYKKLFGIEVSSREYIESFGVDTASIIIAGVEIELLEGKTLDSAVAKYIKKRGPGIHHIAFRVDDIDGAVELLAKRGAKLIDQEPRPGKDNSRVVFIHPGSTNAILYELVEKKAGQSS